MIIDNPYSIIDLIDYFVMQFGSYFLIIDGLLYENFGLQLSQDHIAFLVSLFTVLILVIISFLLVKLFVWLSGIVIDFFTGGEL